MNKHNFLSKSQFIRGLQCYKSLYLYKSHPELRDEVSPKQEALFKNGREVGIVAQRLFPDGVNIPYDGLSYEKQIELTKAEIEKGTSTIYEAAFRHEGVFVKVDILHRGADGWELYEVKSSTKVDEVYLNDAAIQYHVLTGAGLAVSKAAIVHINRDYVKNGDIEVSGLFKIQDVTDTVIKKQGFVAEELGRMREMLEGEMPGIEIGPYCSKPYQCDFKGHCWQHIPEDSVFMLGGNGVDQFALYRQGVIYLKDVSLDILPRGQRIQAEAFLKKKAFINHKGIKKFLDSIWYPLCFLDFETTYMTPIPIFDGTRPYQQVPFQFSLHYLEHEGAEPKHHDFLADANEDPQSSFIENLLPLLPPDACILTYNQTFEIGRLKEMAVRFPEHRDRIEKVIGNVRDLIEPFRRKDIYFPEMNGSNSIKSVLPALIPELTYDTLDISNGTMAAESYMKIRESDDLAEIASIRKSLLEYCGLDTLAMVKILEKLKTTGAV